MTGQVEKDSDSLGFVCRCSACAGLREKQAGHLDAALEVLIETGLLPDEDLDSLRALLAALRRRPTTMNCEKLKVRP